LSKSFSAAEYVLIRWRRAGCPGSFVSSGRNSPCRVLLLLGLGLFHFLLEKKNWARVFLLIVGWINVIDAVSGLLFHTEASRFLSYFKIGIDWDRILYLDRVTDILGLIYWGYAIVVLQFTSSVRQEFFAPPAASVPKQTK
jgi:hypothetical protein